MTEAPVAAATRAGPRRGRTAPRWLAVVATLAGLALGYLVKAPCVERPWVDRFEYRRLCYNDLQPLFHARGIGRGELPYRDVEVEYPVLTGTFMYLAGRALRVVAGPVRGATSDPSYFVVSALLLAPFGLAVTVLLRPHVTRGRLMLWAIGTPTMLYAFHNWELIAVAGGVWGMVELERGRSGLAGAGLGLGASAKLYPLFLLPGAVLGRWAGGDRRGGVRVALGFAGAAALANVPWILVSWRGWLATWTFHARRYPDFGTVWYWAAHHGRRLLPSGWWDPGADGYRDFVSVVSLLLFAGGSLWFLRRGWARRGEAGGYPVAATGLGILSAFLLVSKVHSPQYALWIVPMLALLDVPAWLVAAYLAADLAVHVAIFQWFVVFSEPAPAWKGLSEVAVLGRAAALWGLVWWAARARRLRPEAYRDGSS